MPDLSHTQSSLDNCRIIDLRTVDHANGRLTVYDNAGNVPFDVRRVYYLFDVPAGAERGGHSHVKNIGLIVALSGSFDVVIDDGVSTRRVTLNNPSHGLLLTTGIWRTLDNFSSGSICLVLASEPYDAADYIRDYDEFLRLTSPKRI